MTIYLIKMINESMIISKTNIHKTVFTCWSCIFNYSQKSNLEVLYEMSKKTKTPFFTTQSHLIQIIEDPLQFYLSIYKQTKKAINRIGLSSLYLGTGTLQRFLLKSIIKRVQTVPSLQVKMVFDYNRSLRKQKGQSSIEMMNQMINQQMKKRIKISLNRQSSLKNPLFGEISGVHHQKIALFDDTVIIGGANLSHNYFLNRRDRYMKLRQCSQLADYMYDYLTVMQQNCYQFKNQPQKNERANLQNHYKLWKFSYSPEQYKENIIEQQQQIIRKKQQKQLQASRTLQNSKNKQIPKSKNIAIAQMLGSDIQPYVQVSQQQMASRRQNVRQRLYTTHDQNDIGNHLMDIQNFKSQGQNLTQIGEKVYIFPFIQHPILKEKLQPKVFTSILQNSVSNKLEIKLSSGYLNFTKQILNILKNAQIPVQVLCSAPEANSFYRGGIFKKYIPYFYRNFQGMMLEKWPHKFVIKQYFDGKWSFHAKGSWIKQDDRNYLTVIGSSNYNKRSESRDTQLQLYLYSTCQKFNLRLDKQWNQISKDCHQVSIQKIKQDKEIKYNKLFNFLSKIFSSFL